MIRFVSSCIGAFYPMITYKKIIFSLLMLVSAIPLFGQFPGQGSLGSFGSGGGGSQQLETYIELIDTFGVFYFFADNPAEEKIFADSFLTDFQIYNPVRQRDFEYANLGNPGSPARPLFFQPAFRKGFDIGLHQFDLYHINKKNTPYYRLQHPLTRAGYSQYGKDNLSFQGEYSRNFSEGINVAILAYRTNHLGQYQNQRARNTAFANNWWYHDKKGKYDGFLALTSNSNVHQDNGGVDPLTLVPPFINSPVTISVLRASGQANTRHTHREFTYSHYYKLIGATPTAKPPLQPGFPQQRPDGLPPAFLRDSLSGTTPATIPQRDILPSDTLKNDTIFSQFGQMVTLNGDTIGGTKAAPFTPPPPPLVNNSDAPPKRAITLGHQISYGSSRYLFSDTQPDTSFYGKQFVTHTSGLRHAIHHRKLENDFKISTYKLRDQKQKVRQQRDFLEAGLTHTIHFVNQEANEQTINNLFLHGRFNFNPQDRLKIKTYFHYGFLANIGDYRVQGTMEYALPTVGSLEVGLVQQAYSPSLIAEQFYISESQVWRNNFDKIFETSLRATYRLPKINLELSGQYHLINNYQFYDTESQPQQTGTAISVGQLMIKKNFKAWRFHLDNTVILQQTSTDILRLPQLLTKQSFYYAGFLFKRAMFSHLGIDFRLNDNFQADTYFALTGQFHQQNQRIARAYPLLDIFVNFKVKEFRFFAKYENITKTWYPPLYYQTIGFPENFNAFRFGVSWRFLN